MSQLTLNPTWKSRMTRAVTSGMMLTAVVGWQPTALAQTAPQTTVDRFYQWYLMNDRVSDKISQQKAVFTPELYDQLVQAWAKQPGKDSEFVDFDVFSGTQVRTVKAVVKSTRQPFPNETAEVDVDLYEGRRGTSTTNKPITVKVLLSRKDGSWHIRNLVYPDSDWANLMSILKDINRKVCK
jgi:Protein of unknown function (DUF3828)